MPKKRSSKKRAINTKTGNTKNSSHIAFRAKLTITDKNLNRSVHNLHFRINRKAEMGLIKVYPDHLKQHVDGFGAAFTDAAGYVYAQMNKESQDRFLSLCFDESGHNYRLCRAPIQSNDFSRSTWSYVTDKDDEALETFSLGKDEQYLIPLIKDALHTSDDIKIISSPWSPPAFMKTNRMVRMGGHLKSEYYTRWADVIVRYILAYRKRGIRISALTVQNEPNARQTWESCEMSPEEESNFAINYLKPALVATGLTDVKIFVWDHNKDQILERSETELSVDGAQTAIDGIAFHWYSGDHFEALREATQEFPNKLFYMTEGCEALPRGAASDLTYAEHYAHDIIGDFQNGAHGYIDWNILLDETGGPNHASNYCYAPLMYDRANRHLEVKPAFSYIGHFSHYIKPGAHIMLTSRATDDVEVLAAQNPDGEQVLVLLNTKDEEQDIKVHEGESTASFTLPEHSIATLCWTTQKRDALDGAQPLAKMDAKTAQSSKSAASAHPKKKTSKKAQARDSKRTHKEEDKEIKKREKDLDSRTLLQKLAGKAPEPRVIKAPENSLPFDSSLTHVMSPIERKIVPPDPLIDEPGEDNVPIREVTQVINPVKLEHIPNAPKYDLKSLDINPEVTRVMKPIRSSNATTGDSDLHSVSPMPHMPQETQQLKPIEAAPVKHKIHLFKKSEETKGADSAPDRSDNDHLHSSKKHDAHTTEHTDQKSDTSKNKSHQSLADLISELFNNDDTPDEPEDSGKDTTEENEIANEKTTVITATDVQKILNASKISNEIPSPIDDEEIESLKKHHSSKHSNSSSHEAKEKAAKKDNSQKKPAKEKKKSAGKSNDSGTEENKRKAQAKASSKKDLKESASANQKTQTTKKGNDSKASKTEDTHAKKASLSQVKKGKSKNLHTTKSSKNHSSKNASQSGNARSKQGSNSKASEKNKRNHTVPDNTHKGSSRVKGASGHTQKKAKKNIDVNSNETPNEKSKKDGRQTENHVKAKQKNNHTAEASSPHKENSPKNEHGSADINGTKKVTNSSKKEKTVAEISKKALNSESSKSSQSSENALSKESDDDASQNLQEIEDKIQSSVSHVMKKSMDSLRTLSESDTTQEAKKQAVDFAHKSSRVVSKSLRSMAKSWKSLSQKTKDAQKNKRQQKKPTLRVAPKEVIDSTHEQRAKKRQK